MLGSTRVVVQSATVVESYDFEPWGLLMPGRTLGSGTKEGFGGKEQDSETGLDYFGARYYMPALGRWAAVDPLEEKHPEWSPYNYVLNNPPVLIDPDGRQVSANDPARLLTRLRPSRPWPPGELGARALAGAASAPTSQDMAAGLTPVVSSAQDATIVFTGKNFVTGEHVGTGGRLIALAGLLTPLAGAQFRAGGDLIVGLAGRAIRVGAKTPGGFTLTRDAATRLAGRLEGKLGLRQLDDIIASPTVRRFSDASSPGTVRIFDPSITEFGGHGLNVVINPETRRVVTVFASGDDFMRNANRFSEIAR